MSPDLEKLLEAYHETLICSPDEAVQRATAFQRGLNDVLSRHGATSREALLEALQVLYREFCRARRKPPTMPPRA